MTRSSSTTKKALSWGAVAGLVSVGSGMIFVGANGLSVRASLLGLPDPAPSWAVGAMCLFACTIAAGIMIFRPMRVVRSHILFRFLASISFLGFAVMWFFWFKHRDQLVDGMQTKIMVNDSISKQQIRWAMEKEGLVLFGCDDHSIIVLTKDASMAQRAHKVISSLEGNKGEQTKGKGT